MPRTSASRWLTVALLAISSAGCANMNNTQKGAGLGAAGGAGLGAVIGHQFGATGLGAGIGALAGTAGGALVGNAKDEADRRDYHARQASYERAARYRDARAISNRDVAEMASSGMSDRVIVGTIRERGGRFDTSPHALIALQKYGVSDAVIETMQHYSY